MQSLRRVAASVGLIALLATASCSSDDDTDSSTEDSTATTSVGEDTAPSSADWPMLGRDLDNSRAAVDESDIGVDNVAQLQPVWELTGVQGVTATPVIAEGVLYAGDWTGHVHALDAGTGESIWDTDVQTYYIGGAVALDEERVYVGTFEQRVVALDRETGEEQWSTKVNDHPLGAIFGSPVEVNGTVIIGVASFELMTGTPEDRPTSRGAVVALDATTGEEKWRYWTTAGDESEGPGVSVWSSPAVDVERGQVYIGTGNTYTPPASPHADAVVALDLETGEEVWLNQFTEGDTWRLAEPVGSDSDVGAPPNLFEVGDTAAVGAADKAGVYRALNRDSGEELWSAELTEGGLQGGVLASAAVADGSVFVASNRRSTEADLIALDKETGDEQWRLDLEAHVTGPVSWANGVVYVSDDSGRIAGYDAETGARLWFYEVEAPAAGGISIVDGTVYAGWGWWFSSPPPDAKGGIVAFRVGGEGSGSSSGGSGSGDGEEAVSGKDVYRESCSSCHGSEGEGASGPSFVDVADRLSLEDHLEIVRDGKGNMPAWKDTLTPEEIEAVVEYERTVLNDGG